MDEKIELNGFTYIIQSDKQDKRYEEEVLSEFLDSLISDFKNNLRASYLIAKGYEGKEFNALQVEAQANYAATLEAYNTMVYCFDCYDQDIPAVKELLDYYKLQQVNSYEQLQKLEEGLKDGV